MPVEPQQAQATRTAAAGPVESPPAARRQPGAGGPLVAAPRPEHDDHELPDGRYLIAYRSAPNA
jgi:hypothetical protein